MNENYLDLQLVNQALGGLGDSVTKYMAARRAKQKEEENVQAIRDFFANNIDNPMVSAAGITPQTATVLGGKNPLGVMKILQMFSEANTPQRSVVGGTKEGRREVLTPRYGSGASKLAPGFITEPTNEPDTQAEFNMELAGARLKKRGNPNPSRAEILEEARSMQLELAQTSALGRSDITVQNKMRQDAIEASQQIDAKRKTLTETEKQLKETVSPSEERELNKQIRKLKEEISTFEKIITDYKSKNPGQKDISYNTLPNGVQYRELNG